MSFKLDDIIIDRIQYGVAEANDKMLYVLTQLSEATINITAESKDAVDAQGTLIKRFYNAKQGEFTASNAMLNLNILGAQSGSDKKVGTAVDKIRMPKIIRVAAGSTATLTDLEAGTVKVNAISANGALGKEYVAGAAASATEYVLDGEDFTPPTDPDESLYIVMYERNAEDAVEIVNKADKFPGTVKLTLKALCVDPCSASTLRACYIVLPSFQVSPETEISLTTDGNLSYNGSLQVDYCSPDKALYYIYMADEDEDE